MTPIPLRVGVELEGPHKGKRTLVLLTVAYMRPELVLPVVRDFKVEHLWLERQPGESFDWTAVSRLLADTGLPATLLMVDDSDVPQFGLRQKLSLVMRVPQFQRHAAVLASHLQVLSDLGPFVGAELTVSGVRPFNPSDYEKDETWIP